MSVRASLPRCHWLETSWRRSSHGVSIFTTATDVEHGPVSAMTASDLAMLDLTTAIRTWTSRSSRRPAMPRARPRRRRNAANIPAIDAASSARARLVRTRRAIPRLWPASDVSANTGPNIWMSLRNGSSEKPGSRRMRLISSCPAWMPPNKSLLPAPTELANDFDLPVILHACRASTPRHRHDPRRRCRAWCIARQRRTGAAVMETGFASASAVRSPTRAHAACAATMPLEFLLLETDSPDQPLHGHQGARNEPALLVEVCACVAQLRGVDPTEIAAATSRNAERLFTLRN